MPIALILVPMCLAGGVFGLLGFASQETEDMSPAEQTKRLNTDARERLEREDELRKKIMSTDISGASYREKMAEKAKKESAALEAD
mmetsp:Transcript_95971/g.140230  ORF Transcript_95971/g.140230 Transcript_95971/m.140230 type:complete len:86 (+) Transcript_95971:44-301(+)